MAVIGEAFLIGKRCFGVVETLKSVLLHLTEKSCLATLALELRFNVNTHFYRS
jgi:hypothetical protein